LAKKGLLSICYATLLIRQVPETLNRRLSRAAEKDHRSKEKQALAILAQNLRERPDAEQMIAEAKKLHRQFKRKVTMKEILEATEEDY
jgi:hypothetical protein